MTAKQIPTGKWVLRLPDILTGKVLRTFQDLSDNDKISYVNVRDKLLVSQNLAWKHYRMEFNNVDRAPEQSFSDFVLTVKTTFDRWLRVSHVSDCYSECDLIIKNKIMLYCNFKSSIVSGRKRPAYALRLNKNWG